MQVLVMGGTQFNGLALVHELARQGHAVTVLNRGRTEATLPHGTEGLVADRTDDDALRRALAGRDFDCVFDVSAYRPEDVATMIGLLRGRIGHYVFISSTVIYAASDLLPITEDHPLDRSERQNEYGLNKIAGEELLLRAWREDGFPGSTVALSMVFGPNNILPDREQRMFVRLLEGRPILIPGDGTTLAQVGHVADQARALVAMMQRPQTFGRRYNLTGTDCFSAEGYVDCFAEQLGVEANKVFVPADLMDDVFDGRVPIAQTRVQSRADVRGTRAPDPKVVNQFMLSMLVQRIAPHIHRWNRSVLFSVDRMRRDTGWEPAFTLRSAVADTYAWFERERRHASLEFDFGFEDDLLEKVRAHRGPGA